MSLAENLLNSLPENAYEMPRIGGSAIEEEHIVVRENREIYVPNDLKVIAVEGDKDIETVTIDCVRYWDGKDLSAFDIYINFKLPNGDEGTYIPEKLTVQESIFSFDWVIGREVTAYVGKITFWIVAKLKDDDGKDIYQWGSFQNSDCSIARGGGEIYIQETTSEKDELVQTISIVREYTSESQTPSQTDDYEDPIVVNGKRQIVVPEKLRILGVKGDKNVETVTVKCVRYWDSHDLSSFAVYINYKLPNGVQCTYIPKKLTISEEEFSFDWVIGREITSYVGGLTFWIIAKATDEDGNITYQWGSLQNTDCKIENGGDRIYVPEDKTDKDVISQAIYLSNQNAQQAQKSAQEALNFQEMAENAAKRAEDAANTFNVETDKTLSFVDNVLSVNTVSNIYDEKVDKTLPATASAVEAVIGNINALLDII